MSETALAHIQLACLGLPTLVAACFAWIPLLALGSGSGKKTVVKAWWCPGPSSRQTVASPDILASAYTAYTLDFSQAALLLVSQNLVGMQSGLGTLAHRDVFFSRLRSSSHRAQIAWEAPVALGTLPSTSHQAFQFDNFGPACSDQNKAGRTLAFSNVTRSVRVMSAHDTRMHAVAGICRAPCSCLMPSMTSKTR